MKKALRETQTLHAGGAINFRPAADPLPRGAGQPKFNQLAIVMSALQSPDHTVHSDQSCQLGELCNLHNLHTL